MSYRDRFQMDLIDYKEQAAYDDPDDKDIRKLYKFLLVIRDHFSRLVILRPLQSKSAKCVAWDMLTFTRSPRIVQLVQVNN